ncbi:hypothetical protein CLAUR_004820 [Clostridium felsineum]|nr:hypothetical protein CLAUR_004820 [Clostridium felsineum]
MPVITVEAGILNKEQKISRILFFLRTPSYLI